MDSNKRHACARITEEYHFGHQDTYSETCVKDVYLGLLLCIDVIEHLYACNGARIIPDAGGILSSPFPPPFPQ